MRKHKPHPAQIGFAFDPPEPALAPASLAGFEQRICRAAATILKGDDRDRAVIAAEMSVLLDDQVKVSMVDAYASPAREGHKVIMSRFLALVAVCERHDVLDGLLREIGAAVLVGEELHTARLGHIDRRIEQLKRERQALSKKAPLIGGGAR